DNLFHGGIAGPPNGLFQLPANRLAHRVELLWHAKIEACPNIHTRQRLYRHTHSTDSAFRTSSGESLDFPDFWWPPKRPMRPMDSHSHANTVRLRDVHLGQLLGKLLDPMGNHWHANI